MNRSRGIWLNYKVMTLLLITYTDLNIQKLVLLFTELLLGPVCLLF